MTRTWVSPWLLATVILCGCSVITEFSPDRYLEQTEERCSDNVDNDSNGKTDCADPGCRQFPFCKETSEDRCADEVDNDKDGKIDCLDPDCCIFAHCALEPRCGEGTPAACTDGLDNNSNGLTDCADFGCSVDACCRFPVPVMAESFATVSGGCELPDCGSQPDTCCSDQEQLEWCNAFDGDRWLAWGIPRPRVAGGQFSANQPCAQCAASGLLSAVETELSPRLVVEFEADLKGDPNAMISVGLVKDVIPPMLHQTCGGVVEAFPLLAGVSLSGSQISAHVGGVIQGADLTTPEGIKRIRIEVTEDGALRFVNSEKAFYLSGTVIKSPYPRVRLIVQGRSTAATVDNVLLARRTGCMHHKRWSSGATGPGPVISPSKDVTRFDATSISSPSALFDGSNYRVYYTGRCTSKDCTDPRASALGLATSSDGHTWTLSSGKLTIHGESSSALSDPVVLRRGDGSYLMAYRSETAGGTGQIGIATSDDGLGWTRVAIALVSGGETDWDGGDVAGPALLGYRNRLYLWYVGRDRTSTVSHLGLAVANDDGNFKFVKDEANPVLSPDDDGSSQENQRGIADPWVALGEGKTLHLWYVGLTWGGRSEIHYAVSEDGRFWVRYPQNPVIAAGDSGLFGGTSIRGPTIVDRWGTLLMWYGGVAPNSPHSIGLAVNTSVPPSPLDQ